MGGAHTVVASYLVVANETADSLELHHAVAEIHKHDPDAEFVIVIPATPLNLLQQFEGTVKSARGWRRSERKALGDT